MIGPDTLSQLLNDFNLCVQQSSLGRTIPGQRTITALQHLVHNSLSEAKTVLDNFKDDIPPLGLVLLSVLDGQQNDPINCSRNLLRAVENTDIDIATLCLIGDLCRHFGFLKIGLSACNRAIEIERHSSQSYLCRGLIYSETGDVSAAIDDLFQATQLQPISIAAHIALGNEYRSANMTDAACKCFSTALNIDPGNTKAQSGLDLTLAIILPPWHSTMLNDIIRNEAFEKAIKATVTPSSSVLDVGTGTGLLAMIASRAGAERVIACESVGVLADIAKTITHNNGFSDQIAILHKRSQDLDIVEDIGKPVDILIAEIVDTGLLGENILTTIRDARRRVCKNGATIIPCGASVYACPIESKELALECSVNKICDFDLSPFNSLQPNTYRQTNLSNYEWEMLSDPIQVFDFDFTKDQTAPAEKFFNLDPKSDGTAHGIAFWFDLYLSPEVSLSTSPEAPTTHWHQAVYILSNPLELKQDETVRLIASHDQNKIMLKLE